jgi:WD40 repeat protein
MAFSSGYDGLIKLWNLTSKRTLTFDAGSASRDIAVTDNSPGSRSALDPVMDFCVDVEKEQLVSGTRKGTCSVWDLQTTQQVGALKAAHRGPVSCMMRLSAAIIVTGGQDGTVKILDTRRGMPLVAHKVNCHVDPTQGTTGAVSCLEKAGGLLATGGADNRVCLLDPRMNFQPLHVFSHHHAPVFSLKYALATESPVLFTGAADGVLHCVNLLSRQVLYRLQPSQGAVRAIASTTHLQENKKLVAACEDGKAVVFSF